MPHNPNVRVRHIAFTRCTQALSMPPDIHLGGLRSYRDSSFFALYHPSSLNGTQPKSATCSEVTAISKFMSEIWDIPPANRGPQNHLFSTSQLNGNFDGLYLRIETRYRQSDECVANYKGSPTLSRNDINFGPETA